MKIYLPHIHYTVRVKQISNSPIKNALAYVERDDQNSCTIYLDLKKKLIPGDVAHELIHVLQFICLDRNIDFSTETEHMAYIMHYLMGRIFKQSWV